MCVPLGMQCLERKCQLHKNTFNLGHRQGPTFLGLHSSIKFDQALLHELEHEDQVAVLNEAIDELNDSGGAFELIQDCQLKILLPAK